MNAPDCICSPGRLPLGAFCAGRDDLEREALHDDRISIRAPRAGCDFLRLQDIARALISIHAPRVGRDCIPLNPAEQPENFNPRAPCGARPSARSKKSLLRAFQSTRPVWGATVLRGTRPISPSRISIHAPRVGRDRRQRTRWSRPSIFQSTRPVWGATAIRGARARAEAISIHAPRVGRDKGRGENLVVTLDISIHAPRVGRDSRLSP